MATKTTDERIALIDAKIEKKQKEIESLEARKYKLLHPINVKTLISKAKEKGMTLEMMAEKLELDM